MEPSTKHIQLQTLLTNRHDYLMQGNRQAMNQLLSDNFSFIDGQGRQFDAETYLDHYVDLNQIKWIDQTNESMVVEVFETTALVQEIVEDTFSYGHTSYVGRFRSVSLYHWTTKGWKWHFNQLTPLDPS
ncbi:MULTISPECIES: nuclear transport factor 2 family protein [Exiguobacterium]|uniref:Nuclear transport factor 2 family protein n=1 Tax=Exiguobacterium antarcticum TaxID=132920 RepID=A0ABT6R3H9_9BACL|nr:MULTISPECIES: nuclear transport factor 2 family protein [Exiguobacterium]MCT4780235.1 nuclear transport factor 2 family protein [Exiguobacterium soli]MDI3235506.1 nuclear transport factor 2 family protein [Exiguobacterium antarcticum]